MTPLLNLLLFPSHTFLPWPLHQPIDPRRSRILKPTPPCARSSKGPPRKRDRAFFAALVQNLAKALGTHGAWVTEYFPEKRRLRALAFWMDGQWVKDYEVDIAGTPCERVIDTAKLVHFPDRILDSFLTLKT